MRLIAFEVKKRGGLFFHQSSTSVGDQYLYLKVFIYFICTDIEVDAIWPEWFPVETRRAECIHDVVFQFGDIL